MEPQIIFYPRWKKNKKALILFSKRHKKGFAEADPSFDVDGIDAAHKTIILSALAMVKCQMLIILLLS